MASPSIHAAKDDGSPCFAEFPSTTAGLQAAIDYLGGGKGKVFIGPGTLEHTTVISIHGNCHLQGAGMGVTILKRASGSLLTGDPDFSGNTILTTEYGSNGTPPSVVGDAISNISISDITLDGNSSVFGSVTIAGNNHFGLRSRWVDGLILNNVEAKNFLQHGLATDCCKNVQWSNIKCVLCGQYASASSKNSMSFNNTQAGEAAGYNRFYNLTNFISDSPGDEHIHLAAVSDVTISNCVCNGGERVIELEGTSANATTMERISISNVVGYNHTEEFFANSITAGCTLKHFSMTGCHGYAADGHVQDCISITGAATAHVVNDFVMSGCTFKNYNQGDASGILNVGIRGSSATFSGPIAISDCTFRLGNTSSTRVNCPGIEVTGNVEGLKIVNTNLFNVAGVGVYIHPGASEVVRDFLLSGITVNTCNNVGIMIVENNSTSGIVKNGAVVGCLVVDANQQAGSSQAFQVGASSAAGGGSVSYISYVGCRAYKNAGNTLRGLDFQDGAGGTTDNISATGCDFNTLTAPYNYGGSPTNLRVSILPGLGTAIASAATIAIPTNGSTFHVTGNTNITNGITVNPWDNGRIVTLIFDGTPTVTDTGTSRLNGNFVATADDTLTLQCDGTNWFEVARSAN